MAYYNPSDKYYILVKEDDYGVYEPIETPEVNQRLYPIIPGDGFNMSVNPQQNLIETNVGRGYPFLANNAGIPEVTGTLTCLVDDGANDSASSGTNVQNAKHLIEWGAGESDVPNLTDLPSWSIVVGEATESVDEELFLGVKATSMTLASSSDPGGQRLTASYDLVARRAYYGAECVENTAMTDYPDEADGALANYPTTSGYYHTQGVLTMGLAGSTAVNARVMDFSLTFTNTMDMGLGTGTSMEWCTMMGRQVTCDLTIEYDDPKYRNAFLGYAPTGGSSGSSVTAPANCELSMKYGTAGSSPATQLVLDLKSQIIVTAFEPINSLNTRSRANISFIARVGTSVGAFTPDFSFTLA